MMMMIVMMMMVVMTMPMAMQGPDEENIQHSHNLLMKASSSTPERAMSLRLISCALSSHVKPLQKPRTTCKHSPALAQGIRLSIRHHEG